MDTVIGILFFVIFLIVYYVVLPRLGVPT